MWSAVTGTTTRRTRFTPWSCTTRKAMSSASVETHGEMPPPPGSARPAHAYAARIRRIVDWANVPAMAPVSAASVLDPAPLDDERQPSSPARLAGRPVPS